MSERTVNSDWCTGRRLPGTAAPLRGWSDLAFRVIVLIFFAEFIVSLGYIGYLLSPSHELRVAAGVFATGYFLGLVTRGRK